ncbi:hypothetical protein GmarT_17010 [Gimesia maris]|uniref:Uncharacterized protein n=2 Tax=Gimesia maris TaxID=122 RepID=A0ABX5YJH4_9PLAN|nr:hypothetical protein CA11_16780 [Gimesia maris]QEG15857.1 hypothetical protein GmarT_17010 [Gimesia maris]
MLGVWEAGLIACWIILWKGLGRSRGMNSKMWRTVLIWERCLAVLRRCLDENLRSASTRRHTLGTGVVLTSEYLEKTGSFIVKSTNKCRVFRCTVNWIRARPKTTLIAGGAQRSSSFYAAGVRECAAAGVGSSVLQADGNAAVIRDTVKSL